MGRGLLFPFSYIYKEDGGYYVFIFAFSHAYKNCRFLSALKDSYSEQFNLPPLQKRVAKNVIKSEQKFGFHSINRTHMINSLGKENQFTESGYIMQQI